jgi:hypothetical protein
MMSLVGGLIAVLIGIIGLIQWFPYFLKGLMATLPIMFILGGALAAYLGYEELNDKTASESFDNEKEELKSEVESLKEELNSLKGDKEEAE